MSTFEELLTRRRSVRGFLPQAVEEDTLQKIFALAQLAPSNCNTQPWNLYVASGDSCQRIRETLINKAVAGEPMNPDFGFNPNFQGEYRKRQVDCAFALYNCMGIERSDKPGRQMALLRNYELFDAPHVVFIGMPKGFGVINGLDVGIYVQTLMLAMAQYEVASCAQGALGYYPEVVREAFGLDEDMGILLGISFGYEDESVPANNTRTSRESVDNVVNFLT